MWLLIVVAILLAVGIGMYRIRGRGRWFGALPQPDGWLLEAGRDAKSQKLRSATIGVPFECAFDFECLPETALDRWCKRVGLTRELQSGHAPFDKDVYLVCDDDRLREVLRNDTELTWNLHRLVVGKHPQFTFRKLVCRGGTLRAEYKATGREIEPLEAHALAPLQVAAARLPPPPAFTEKRRDPHFANAMLVLAATVALAINGVVQLVRMIVGDDTLIVERGLMWVYGALAAAVLLAGLVVFAVKTLIGTSRFQRVLAEVLVLGSFGCLASAVSLVRDINTSLDFGVADPQRATVGFKEARTTNAGRTRSTTYYVTYHGVELPNDGEIRSTERQYARMRTAMPVVVNFHDGALGIRWVSSIDPAPYDFTP